jgi:hypothetical protein
LAVFAMDGPGQGLLAATSTLRPAYEQVVGRVIDALGVARVGVVGLSLGGYFAARAAALEVQLGRGGHHEIDGSGTAVPPALGQDHLD